MPACYILYSLSHDRYYIGATHEDVLIRFQKHNEKSYGTDKATAYTGDWQIYLVIECITYAQAVNIERHIKKMKSRTYLENLRKYPEMTEKLIARYNYGT